MRKTLSKMKFCAKTSRRGEGATAKAPEAELLAAPRASGLQEGRDRWWGLRRGSGARGHRGGGLAGRKGPSQARGPGEEGRTEQEKKTGGHGVQGAEGTGPQTCWQGLPPTSPGPEAGLGRKVLNRGRSKDGDQPPGESHETTERLAVQRTKELLRDTCDTSRELGRGGTMHG